jgi:hypothetical protein
MRTASLVIISVDFEMILMCNLDIGVDTSNVYPLYVFIICFAFIRQFQVPIVLTMKSAVLSPDLCVFLPYFHPHSLLPILPKLL